MCSLNSLPLFLSLSLSLHPSLYPILFFINLLFYCYTASTIGDGDGPKQFI
jgi:hypothetical protein